MQTDAQENKIQEKDDRILGLLDQIAKNMVRKEDVDRIVKDAVDDVNAKWQNFPTSLQTLGILIHTEDVEILDPRFGRILLPK